MNALRILETLDRHLTRSCALTIYGRAALALGFPDASPEHRGSMDVDVILPTSQAEEFLTEFYFWNAQHAANAELSRDGLYITHLFREAQVILMPDWLNTRIKLDLPLKRIDLYRPDNLNLILTKMMRGDDQDLQDIRFLLSRSSIGVNELENAFRSARVPDLVEVREFFQKVQPRVLALARDMGR